MAERSKAAVLKTARAQALEGSNPSLSASFSRWREFRVRVRGVVARAAAREALHSARRRARGSIRVIEWWTDEHNIFVKLLSEA